MNSLASKKKLFVSERSTRAKSTRGRHWRPVSRSRFCSSSWWKMGGKLRTGSTWTRRESTRGKLMSWAPLNHNCFSNRNCRRSQVLRRNTAINGRAGSAKCNMTEKWKLSLGMSECGEIKIMEKGGLILKISTGKAIKSTNIK